jgi:hypothetical protein
MPKKKWTHLALTALALAATTGAASAGPTLDAIKQRGTLVCGVHTGLTGFSAPDNTGKYAGIDVDYCKALAAAILGSADKVKYVPLTAQQRFAQPARVVELIRPSLENAVSCWSSPHHMRAFASPPSIAVKHCRIELGA